MEGIRQGSKKELWHSLKRSSLPEELIKVIQNMCDERLTAVRGVLLTQQTSLALRLDCTRDQPQAYFYLLF